MLLLWYKKANNEQFRVYLKSQKRVVDSGADPGIGSVGGGGGGGGGGGKGEGVAGVGQIRRRSRPGEGTGGGHPSRPARPGAL